LKFSSTNQIIAVTASGIGFIDSVYLAIIKFTQNQNLCLKGVGDCWTVNNSSYSQVFGIPLSLFGAAAYLVLLILFIGKIRLPISTVIKDQLAFGVSLSGFIYSIYLTYLEIAVIKAICPFCVVSAIMMTVIFICTLLRLVHSQSEFTLSLEEKNG